MPWARTSPASSGRPSRPAYCWLWSAETEPKTYFTPETEVFEFGCGTGSTAIRHAPYVKHIHATDYSSAMIEIARSKAAAESITNIDFECISVAAVRKPDDSVDVVITHSILHLLPNVEDVIRKVYAMLKPGGAFVTSTVCVGDASIFWRVLLPTLRFLWPVRGVP